MTREKVIKKLKWFKEYNEEDYCGGDRIQDEYGDWYYRVTEQDFEAFDVAIKALEQEPKTGHWVDDEVDSFSKSFGYKKFHCSNCNSTFSGTNVEKTDYCPNCGTKIISEVEDEQTN